MRCDPALKLLFILSVSAAAIAYPLLMTEDVSADAEMDSSSDMKGYIRQTGQLGGIRNTGNNLIAMVPIESDTSYDVSISADNRFRVGTLRSSDLRTDVYLTNFYVSPKDDNASSFIGDDSCTLVSGADHDIMLIFYWTETSVQSASVIRDSISVVKTTVTISGDADEGVLVGNEWSYSPVSSPDGAIVSVSGADWLSVSGNTVSGISTAIGTYHVVVTSDKHGCNGAVKELSIAVVSILEFTSTCRDGVTANE